MIASIKKKIWNIMRIVFKIKIFEKILLPLAKDKQIYSRIATMTPPHYMYRNPSYRVARKNDLRLIANLYDYNDWKAYWGFRETERDQLYKLAENAKTVIDIGTNNGWVLMNIATIIKKNNGFIYGFEPHPITYRRCITNIEKSKIINCKVFNVGCSDISGELIMSVVDQTNSGQNRIVDLGEEPFYQNDVKVKVVKLDEQFVDLPGIDLIKIDVEGFELHVLKGAESLLKKYRPVLFIEIDDALLKANNTCPQQVLNFLRHNYNYIIKNASNMRIIEENDCLENCHLDAICYPIALG